MYQTNLYSEGAGVGAKATYVFNKGGENTCMIQSNPQGQEGVGKVTDVVALAPGQKYFRMEV